MYSERAAHPLLYPWHRVLTDCLIPEMTGSVCRSNIQIVGPVGILGITSRSERLSVISEKTLYTQELRSKIKYLSMLSNTITTAYDKLNYISMYRY